jgi:hypothetical protein
VQLVCVGGYDGKSYEMAELYSPPARKWFRVADMLTKRHAAAAAYLNGRVYVAGGNDGKHCLNTVECYDAGEKTWTPVVPMKKARMVHGLVELGGMLYAIGGWNTKHRLDSVECYDAVKRCWTEVAPLATARSNAAYCAFQVSTSLGNHAPVPTYAYLASHFGIIT